MSRQMSPTAFSVLRFDDKKITRLLSELANELEWTIVKVNVRYLFSENEGEFSTVEDPTLIEILNANSVSTESISVQLSNSVRLKVARTYDRQNRKFTDTIDQFTIDPGGRDPAITNQQFADCLGRARRRFDAIDTKPYMAVLGDAERKIYESREQELQKLERMQEHFFEKMMSFVSNQQEQQQAFQRKLEEEYASRQSKLDAQYQQRSQELDDREADLRKMRAEIDDRQNQDARRGIYKEIKKKMEERNKTFELTNGTQLRRRVPFWFTLILLGLIGWLFWYCFEKNVVTSTAQINWVAVGSQISFGVVFIGVATFFIRWNNQWFQKHADEEFKLKRLDLDLDRASWLVELAMEWKNLTKTEIPPELIEKLSFNLFTSDESKHFDVHPAETLFSALLGKNGNINVEVPGKFSLGRSESEK